MSDLIDAQKNAPQPGSIATVAWFSMQVKDQTEIYFADKNDPANGDIDPVFLLAAYVLEAKPHRSGATTYYGVTTGYDVADEWKKAFAGISHLANAQSAEDKIAFDNLRKAKNLPGEKKQNWTKISLSSKIAAAPSPSSTGLVDDIFVPQRSRFGTTDEDFMLIGNPVWGTHTIPRLYMMAAIMLESARRASVVSLVVDKRGIVVAHGIKGPMDGGCGHAEVKAIFSLKGRLPDAGGAIFGTLKPCTMCAGLLHATDPTGKLRKYWVRDDANSAADWSRIGKGFKLDNGHALDKNCENVKFLKTSNGGSFFEEFTGVRKRSQTTSDAKKASPEQERKWYVAWANSYQFPKGGSWSNLCFRSNDAATNDNVKTKLVEMTVNGTTSLEAFVGQHLAFKAQGPKYPKGWRGMDNDSAKTIKDACKQYRDDQFAKAYSSQVIKIIAWNPDSVALNNSVRTAFKAKQKKYDDPEFRNPNVKVVLDYLTGYLTQMNVKI